MSAVLDEEQQVGDAIAEDNYRGLIERLSGR